MHGSLVGLPPILIHYADDEMLRPEILRFAALAESAGVAVEAVELHRLWHSVIVLSGTLAGATEKARDAGAWLRTRLDEGTAEEPVAASA
jgi:acetyl esterase/lipase